MLMPSVPAQTYFVVEPEERAAAREYGLDIDGLLNPTGPSGHQLMQILRVVVRHQVVGQRLVPTSRTIERLTPPAPPVGVRTFSVRVVLTGQAAPLPFPLANE